MLELVLISITGGTHPCYFVRNSPVQRPDVTVEHQDRDYDQGQAKHGYNL